MTTYIALFRGLNVGGSHKVPMADLRALLADLGFEGPRTYIQSGNAIFDAGGDTQSVTDALETGFEKRFGFASPTVLITARDLARAIAESPFAGLTDDHKMLHLGLFRGDPDPQRLKLLEVLPKDGERYEVHGRLVYLYLPQYSARSDLANAVASKNLGAPVTLRNWRTVGVLEEMARQPA